MAKYAIKPNQMDLVNCFFAIRYNTSRVNNSIVVDNIDVVIEMWVKYPIIMPITRQSVNLIIVKLSNRILSKDIKYLIKFYVPHEMLLANKLR